MYANSAHDDVKDALASVIDFAVPPSTFLSGLNRQNQEMMFNTRFGGVA